MDADRIPATIEVGLMNNYAFDSTFVPPVILCLQRDASGLVGKNHAGSRVGGLHPEIFSHTALP